MDQEKIKAVKSLIAVPLDQQQSQKMYLLLECTRAAGNLSFRITVYQCLFLYAANFLPPQSFSSPKAVTPHIILEITGLGCILLPTQTLLKCTWKEDGNERQKGGREETGIIASQDFYFIKHKNEYTQYLSIKRRNCNASVVGLLSYIS